MSTAKLTLIVVITGAVCFSCPASDAEHTNLISATARDLYKATTWGNETNAIKFGVRLPYLNFSSLGDKFMVRTYLFNTGNYDRVGLLRPPHGYRLDISLKNKEGRPVARTAEGDALCKTPHSGLRSRDNFYWLPTGSPATYDEGFSLLRCFKIRHPGVYVLTTKPRLYARIASSDYTAVNVAEVHVEIEVTKADLQP